MRRAQSIHHVNMACQSTSSAFLGPRQVHKCVTAYPRDRHCQNLHKHRLSHPAKRRCRTKSALSAWCGPLPGSTETPSYETTLSIHTHVHSLLKPQTH